MCYLPTSRLIKTVTNQSAQEMFEVEGDGENLVVHRLKHANVKVGSENVIIDGFEAEADEYNIRGERCAYLQRCGCLR